MEPEGIIEAILRVYFSPIVFLPLKDSGGSTLFLFAVMYSEGGSLPRLMAFNAQGSICRSWLRTSLHVRARTFNTWRSAASACVKSAPYVHLSGSL